MPTKLPRINVTVTEEQHALLLELATLQGGSASGFLRQYVDASTPLLRAAVPLLRRAAKETEVSKAEAARLLQEPLKRLQEMGVLDQMDLIDDTELRDRVTGRNAASGPASEAERNAVAGTDGDRKN